MIRAIVTDIEGTTSDIRFVHNVLFPYARERLAGFVTAQQHAEPVKTPPPPAPPTLSLPSSPLWMKTVNPRR